MKVLKAIGFIAAMIALLAISMIIVVVMVEADLGDGMLIAISAAVCVAAPLWGIAGARRLARWQALALLFPTMTLGIYALITASRRYPPFSPYLVGCAAAITFVIVGCALSWRSVQPVAALFADDAADSRRGDILTVGGVHLLVGLLFFQPAILLLNGQAEARPPLVLASTVTRMYRTHGKGAADYIVLDGPAAAYHSGTRAAGEFELPADTYRTWRVGDRICLNVHAGLMRFDWWSLKDC